MSSLTERFVQAQAEIAKKASEEEAIRIRSAQVALQATQQANIEAQKKIQEATRQKQERVASLIASLSPLLDTVGARDQLEEVRRIWKVGTIDPAPQLISESPIPSVGLALRYRRVGVSCSYMQTMVQDGEDGTVHESSKLYLDERALFIITGQEKNHLTVQISSGERGLRSRSCTRWGIMGGEARSRNPESYDPALYNLRLEAGPAQFQISNPEHARAVLENQLFDVLLRTEKFIQQPLQMQENSRISIANDPFTSLPPAQSYYRSLMRSIRGDSVPWYKKLLT